MMIHKPVSLADQVFERLETDILSGVYPVGSVLTEGQICDALGVSRTPVREALRRLEQEHILESLPKGLLVLGITFEDAMCIYEIREKIEGMAAAACARHVTGEQLSELAELVQLQTFYAENGNSEKVKQLDSDFHRMIYSLSGSTVLYDTLLPLHTKVQKFRKAAIQKKSRADQSTAEHREIYQASAARDEQAAEAAMLRHIQHAKAYLADAYDASEGGTAQ